MRSRSRFTLALAGLLVSSCQGKTEPRGASREAAPKADAPAAASASQLDDRPTTAAPQPPEAVADPARADPGHDDPLGTRFRDPPWFRTDLIEGAQVVSTSRSEADENGFFGSHILFELPEGTSVEQCADLVTEKVEPSVPALERATEGDRIKVTGSTDRYRVILMCGEAKGVMRAYVSLEWFA
jgi:hypothetical protein